MDFVALPFLPIEGLPRALDVLRNRMRPCEERLAIRRDKRGKGKVLGREVSVMEVHLNGPLSHGSGDWYRNSIPLC